MLLRPFNCATTIIAEKNIDSLPFLMVYCNSCRGVEQSVARRAHNPKVAGSSPVPATNADIAQSVERILGKDKVTSSILVISSI